MADRSDDWLSDVELAFLRELDRRGVRYLLVGMSAAIAVSKRAAARSKDSLALKQIEEVIAVLARSKRSPAGDA